MGKTKGKASLIASKQKIKEVLEQQKQLLKINEARFSEKTPQLNSHNIFQTKDKKIHKNKNPNKKSMDSKISSRKSSHTDSCTPVQTVNLFEVKSFINPNPRPEPILQPFVEPGIGSKPTQAIILNYNPFTNQQNENFLNEDIQNPLLPEEYLYHILADQETEDHDVDLKKLVIPYDETLKALNEYNIKGNSNRQILTASSKLLEESAGPINPKRTRELPIFQNEYEIIESVKQNLVTVICGSTGSGKSTQVPQFICQSGFLNFGNVVVTQPRRIAAISLAKRVAEETETKLGEQVGFQVRFESKFSNETQLMFVTDGILMNELMSDFLLSKYSVIIVDEAHERKMASDVLIGVLSRVVRIRAKLALNDYQTSSNPKIHPLRLVLMSATLKIEDFVENRELFASPPPLIKISAKRFPVHIYFAKETLEDYFQEAIKKTRKIHSTLPSGNLLVFLTGREEIIRFCKELYQELKYIRNAPKTAEAENENLFEQIFDNENSQMEIENKSNDLSENEVENHQDQEQPKNTHNSDQDNQGFYVSETFVIVPLYSKLPANYQDKIFKTFAGKRVIIVGTNVAETSITIDGLKYIIDCGKEKNKTVDLRSGLETYSVDWISQSSAKQRTGRVGRTQTGYCYRLYTPAVYGKLEKHRAPEITYLPLNFTILQMVKMGIQNVLKFPFPTRPPRSQLILAIDELVKLEALLKINDEFDIKLTELGETLSFIPLEPKYSKIILQSRQS